MNELKTVRLYGALGARFGRVHRLVIASPAEACRALSVILPGFEQYMQTAHLRGLRFAVFRGKKNIGQDELKHNSGEEDIRIAPVISGSKRGGVLQTILGAVLVVGALALGPVGIGAIAGSTAMSIGLMGGSMMIGGVVQMLSPQPGGLASRQDPDNAPSYAFGGPVNTTAMGNPVGLLYGEREIGGAIVSAGIYTNDQ
ncbi:tail assembly protein [Cronobacter sakazakii]|uniref:tail protein n=1 Tax=Cronobacter phage ENT39118 TaxID=984175 RepID=UPI000201F42B|nr:MULTISPECIES: tail assembly protein [Cronobacter]YP_007238121.1 tail protein [Cronobacter phage ENT39118]CCK12841.1 Phage tail assembly protein I [Cronobacter sakazakii 680]ADZ13602.1 tail assembly protein [Cronobacter phage ENT39118]AKE95112.1 phage tail assembly protein [Cronobacter sakazakii]EGT4269317.1 tail assembly protein [Cronobacter sakazakii]EGT4286406.1 tail assembly protein [Cronobacter sakazakii]